MPSVAVAGRHLLTGRRRGAVAVVVAAAVVLFGLWWTSGGEPRGAADELQRRLARAREPDRFRFVHRSGGTRVLDCFLPNRAISGAVDYNADTLVISDTSGVEIARKTSRRVFLHQSVFAEDAVPTAWLALDLPLGDALHADLKPAVGTHLAGYVFVVGLPPSGKATAMAALDAAEAVELAGTTSIGGRSAVGWRITVDRDKFLKESNSANMTATTGEDSEDVQPPAIEVWIDGRNEIVRVAVQPTRPDGSVAEPEGGWTIEYEVPGPVLTDAQPDSFTAIGDVQLDRLTGGRSRRSCELPM